MIRFVGIFLLVFLGINPAIAHHGLDTFDTSELIEFTGKVIDFRLMDPHSVLVVEVRNSDGSATIWEVEGGSASGILSSGLTQQFLRSQPLVQIKGFQSKDGLCTPRCRVAGEDFQFEGS